MILTPIPDDSLCERLQIFASHLSNPGHRATFLRLAVPANAARAAGEDAARHHAEALALAAGFGMGWLPGPPSLDFTWNGTHLRSGTEAYVLIHDVAHYQLAAPERRHVPDFGLGAGPETGACEDADRLATVFGIDRDHEEALSSLLGVLWEAELGQPALASFLDQNWLEGAGRPSTAAFFAAMLDTLAAGGFADAAFHPTTRLRSAADPVPLLVAQASVYSRPFRKARCAVPQNACGRRGSAGTSSPADACAAAGGGTTTRPPVRARQAEEPA